VKAPVVSISLQYQYRGGIPRYCAKYCDIWFSSYCPALLNLGRQLQLDLIPGAWHWCPLPMHHCLPAPPAGMHTPRGSKLSLGSSGSVLHYTPAVAPWWIPQAAWIAAVGNLKTGSQVTARGVYVQQLLDDLIYQLAVLTLSIPTTATKQSVAMFLYMTEAAI